ncbi:(S)-N-methylcoclaurine 3'-hydroxylase isozyme [Thalictrum thalictroides]|uniref:(S)-N-methylcoclaurine 3'-hydroxylase isozyme n=1 Tax=Thalictrum thalictroides TaxID=46969 RepID=A0A7J6V5L6_THATH|nr:(S)-N-methylcoclaurine 3'-hydroxylase isozyme [Thalictrum thalictroides]
MEVLSTAMVSLLLIFLFIFFILRDSQKKDLPPGPSPSPIVGNLLQLGKKPHAEFAKLALEYGELFTLKLGSQTVVVASSPAAAAEILKTHDKILSGRYVFQSIRVKEHNDYSIVWSECNENWKFLRKVCRTELFSPKMIESQAYIREAKALDMVRFLRNKEDEVVKIVEVVFSTLFNIFGKLIFSKDVFDLEDPTGGSAELKEHLWKLMDMGKYSTNPADYFPIMGKFDLFGQRREAAKVLKQIYDVWGVMLKERRRSIKVNKENDFVNVLLNAGLDDQKINALLMDIFGAGTETSASTIEWAITELTKNPRNFEWSLPLGVNTHELNMDEKFGLTLQKDPPLLIVLKARTSMKLQD